MSSKREPQEDAAKAVQKMCATSTQTVPSFTLSSLVSEGWYLPQQPASPAAPGMQESCAHTAHNRRDATTQTHHQEDKLLK